MNTTLDSVALGGPSPEVSAIIGVENDAAWTGSLARKLTDRAGSIGASVD